MEYEVLSGTESLCPFCLEKLKAQIKTKDNMVYIEKICEEHGLFRSKIWSGTEDFKKWSRPKIPIEKRFNMVEVEKGCPFDCGLCSLHLQHTCTAVFEITERCNFNCNYCFADSGKENASDLSMEKIEELLRNVHTISPDCNIQISGGEPTLREDLSLIVEKAVEKGFGFVQLNTNGYKIAKDRNLIKDLKKSGLDSVFLQFDGLRDEVYRNIRNRELLSLKIEAVRKCTENNVGVVLVPTVIPGVNDGDLGDILSFALKNAPGVRGVHFQPVSYFGRISKIPKDEDRITIPEILEKIEIQSGGIFLKEHFRPSSCEHSLCSFNSKYLINEDGSLTNLQSFKDGCCSPVKAEKGAKMAKESVARQWGTPLEKCSCSNDTDGLARFIQRAKTDIFSVSGMAFQDAWNLDIERLKGCCIHSVSKDGRLIPFCAYNLTNNEGKGLYRDYD